MTKRTVLAAIFVFLGVSWIGALLLAASSWRPNVPEQVLIVGFNAMALLLLVALVALHRMQGGADGRRGRIGARLIVASLPMLVVTALGVWLVQSLALSEGNDFIFSPAFAVLLIGVMVLPVPTALIALGGTLLLTIGMTLGKVRHSTPLWIFLAGIAVLTLTFSALFDFAVLSMAGTLTSATGLVLLGISVSRQKPRDAADEPDLSPVAPAVVVLGNR